MNKNLLVMAMSLMLSGAAATTQAAMLNAGDLLTINAGVTDNDLGVIVGGSWLGVDANGNGSIASSEKSAIYPGTDAGIIMGSTQSPGQIDYWGDISNTVYDYTTVVAPSGGTASGINLNGWTIAWPAAPPIPMGSGAWGAGFSNGVANFTWSGIYGDTYTLSYHATVPVGDPSGFGGVQFAWYLTGAVVAAPSSVPLPAAVWLFGSGLLGVLGFTRRQTT